MAKPLTGRKVFVMFAGGFGVIIAANLTLAVNAVRTFPGLETDNSYVASQHFDADRRAQQALGWTVDADLGGGLLSLAITGRDGAPVQPASISAILGRATEAADDIDLAFRPEDGRLVADAPGTHGRWVLRLAMVAEDGTKFRQIITLVADEADA